MIVWLCHWPGEEMTKESILIPAGTSGEHSHAQFPFFMVALCGVPSEHWLYLHWSAQVKFPTVK